MFIVSVLSLCFVGFFTHSPWLYLPFSILACLFIKYFSILYSPIKNHNCLLSFSDRTLAASGAFWLKPTIYSANLTSLGLNTIVVWVAQLWLDGGNKTLWRHVEPINCNIAVIATSLIPAMLRHASEVVLCTAFLKIQVQICDENLASEVFEGNAE